MAAKHTQSGLSDAQLRAIGRVTVQAAYLEYVVDLMLDIYLMYGLKSIQVAKEIQGSLTRDKVKRSLLQKLLIAERPANIEKITNIFSDLGKVFTDRHELVHDIWERYGRSGKIKQKQRKQSKLPPRVHTARTINSIADEFIRLLNELTEFKPPAASPPTRQSALSRILLTPGSQIYSTSPSPVGQARGFLAPPPPHRPSED